MIHRVLELTNHLISRARNPQHNYQSLIIKMVKDNKMALRLDDVFEKAFTLKNILNLSDRWIFRNFDKIDNFSKTQFYSNTKWTLIAIAIGYVSNECYDHHRKWKEIEDKIMNGDEQFYNQARLMTKQLVKEQVFESEYVLKNLNFALTKLIMANPDIRFTLARAIGLSLNYDLTRDNLSHLAKIDLIKKYILYEKYTEENLKQIILWIMREKYYRSLLGVTLYTYILTPFSQTILTYKAIQALKWDETIYNVIGGGVSGLYQTLVDPSLGKNVYGYITNLFT